MARLYNEKMRCGLGCDENWASSSYKVNETDSENNVSPIETEIGTQLDCKYKQFLSKLLIAKNRK